MISAIRILEFDAGHRVVGHESKCRTPHGHRYAAHIYCRAKQSADSLDKLGRVIDFSVIKERIGKWIDDNWDHTMILWSKDPDIEKFKLMSGYKDPSIHLFNPTAENMAWYLLNVICQDELENTAVEAYKIRLYETPNCYVEVDLDPPGGGLPGGNG